VLDALDEGAVDRHADAVAADWARSVTAAIVNVSCGALIE